MGNRGILHDQAGNLTHRRWRHKNWIICLTSFKNRRRKILTPGRYTELFFLDEATALSAGHRPCFECRRHDYFRFQESLRDALGPNVPLDAKSLDERLHRERAVPRRFEQRMWVSRLSNLPDGAFVKLAGDDHFYLLWRERLHCWDMSGYASSAPISTTMKDDTVAVLTPPTAVLALSAGFVPVVHPTACN